MKTAKTSIVIHRKTDVFEKLNLETDVTTNFALSEYNPGIAAYIGQSDYNAGAAYLYDMKKKRPACWPIR